MTKTQRLDKSLKYKLRLSLKPGTKRKNITSQFKTK